ncbi:SGNH/GDSL hydrolase family protein [Desertifilum sp. FACHB-1129]|uniref:AlgX/AlgJ SGNH hydrolase-like domain-containing protein n=1 Tax=Desertifilum tharense IPPAS B-1220 TaxID=1781255 RepID=A0A1E5QE70_9CYAN|nr:MULTISPECIES: SGNH/GDSL hydrolase family protein [Desertifilum]MDA0209099.1 SGNH/GDSL hydrolase family protein [Cyanobacteria bacterium FC1]MBD2310582.1 SGNH/GDSL hydrolase family protein [Desertifilum sp. FACHB-1129]MBD2322034.1 SGNH/GDSL hydrolase family protein [Desertifilum sp. FACHB-866]MBD2332161.1 SGNH/GDSL hydrolase family protein [Desertifilum sp. FACHB-868]OEJ72884.1 hypothetical protein BH720_23230 [Desertifilum tharense IPPAS B-1220]
MFKFKKLPALLGQTAIILTISLIFTEVALRIYNKFNPSFVFYDASYNRYRGKPFADDYDFQLNSRGFKDVEFEVEKAPDTYRILGIGDSFAYGVVPYEHNYYTRLEEKLNQSNGNFEVINMGIPNLDPKDYLAILINEGLELNPDMVVLSFFIGNDFLNSKSERRSLYTYSYTASFVNFIVQLARKYEGNVIHGKYVYQDDTKTLEDDAFLAVQQHRSILFYKDNNGFADDVETTFDYLQRIQEICNSRNIQLVVVLIPDENQVNPELQAQVVESLGGSLEYYDFDIPNRLLTQKLGQANIAYLDLLDLFRTETNNQLLYKPNDTHWNIPGNELAAIEIHRYLREQFFNTSANH